jgi:hypothetical protein
MQRPDPLMTASYGATDVDVQKARVLWMEELFFLDGRDMISHPQHGLFVGLAEKYRNLESTDGY